MIRGIQLLQNIGQFESVDTAAAIELGRVVLIYGENGRGKTTLAAVLRSLATGDPLPIMERRRLNAQHAPHVVVDCEDGPPAAVFRDGGWTCADRMQPQLVVFDDVFVDENVHSGLAVDARHRQNLHEFVLGAQGVSLSRQLRGLVSRIEGHNTALREKSDAIPERERHGLSVDDFCALPEAQGIDAAIKEIERAHAAALDRDTVAREALFEPLGLPAFDTEAIDVVLARELPDLDAEAEARVRAHVEALEPGGEQWVGDGMQRVAPEKPCPFCAQDLAGSTLLAHYRAYFSEGYANLKRSVEELLRAVLHAHAGDVPAAFERAVRVVGERRQYWSRFCEVPAVPIDTAPIVRHWSAAREAVVAALASKQAAPLEPRALAAEARAAIAAYEAHRQRIAEISAALTAANEAVQVVKEQTAAANRDAIATDLRRLQATKARHTSEIAALCDEYLAEKKAKARTEDERAETRTAQDEYRADAFPASQTAINSYLRRFNAGFRLDRVSSAMTRGGGTCNYDVVINDSHITVAGDTTPEGEPSFRNTLSAGDRKALALAFFFASLDQDPDLGNKVVVIDDPISSLDNHRSLTTVQEVRRLADRAGQVLLLSHDKPFLCRLWDGTDRTMRVALEIVRAGTGSTLREWSVDEDSLTEHDRRHDRLRTYIDTADGDQREVARSIRPHLEAYLRVALPEQFPPETLLGRFLERCRQRRGQPDEILDQATIEELAGLVEYANRFHHDTNPAWKPR